MGGENAPDQPLAAIRLTFCESVGSIAISRTVIPLAMSAGVLREVWPLSADFHTPSVPKPANAKFASLVENAIAVACFGASAACQVCPASRLMSKPESAVAAPTSEESLGQTATVKTDPPTASPTRVFP